jgi:hypothetical protein
VSELAAALAGGTTVRRDGPAPFVPPVPSNGRGGRVTGVGGAAVGRPGGGPRVAAVIGIALACLGLLAAVGLGLGGGDDGGGGAESLADTQKTTPAPAAAEPEPQPEPAPEPEPAAPPGGEASAAALNDEGFALIGQGRYDQAIPILERAVAGSEGSAGLTHAYALFNLGNALRLAGRPEEAIPILERRLQIPNQRGTVARELALAREQASD